MFMQGGKSGYMNPSDSTARTRADRKQDTRRRILDAALRLVEEGRSPTALGLREVAREAGMAAPSLYNHFADMEALGLALVDEALIRLRAIARAARSEMAGNDTRPALHTLLQQFLVYVNRFEPVLRLLIMQWFNPNPEYRKSIRREMAMMQQDMAENFRQAAQLKGRDDSRYETESQAIVSLLIVWVLDAMHLDREQREAGLVRLEQQLLMVLAGSRALSGLPVADLIGATKAPE